MTSSIHDKIRKLLALSSSPNDHEAAVALSIAQKLMMQHGIDQDQLHPEKKSQVTESELHDFKMEFQLRAAQAAGYLYGCKVLRYGQLGKLSFVGRSDNRQIAEATWSFFLLQIESWYKNELPAGMTQGERARYRKEYKLSMSEQLVFRCQDFRPASHETALVIHKDQLDQEIKDFFNDRGIRSKEVKSRKITHMGAHIRGNQAGKAADIHRTVK